MAQTSFKWLALLGGVALGTASLAVAQDSGPLIDALVKKGILNDQEAEEIRADLVRDFGTTSSGKLDVSSGVTRLRISGDARVRYQFDNEQSNPAGAADDRDRNRYRYRVRLGFLADIGPKWTVATRLETASGATSTNADFGSGTDNFDKAGDVVYFGQAYINYRDKDLLGSDALDLRFGKLPHKFFNPGVNGFWIDSDINFEGAAQELVYNDLGIKDSKLSLRTGQFILNNNAANSGSTATGSSTTYTFTGAGGALQRIVTTNNTATSPSLLLINQAEFATKTFKLAPTYVMFAAPGEHDRSTVSTSTVTGYAVNGTPIFGPATVSTGQNNDTSVYNNLHAILLPLEYTMSLGAKPLALYGSYSYNFSGKQRAQRLANSTTINDDASMYNLGVRYGENRLRGDYQLVGEYRYVGNGSYSSLLLDSDFNGGLLNGQGFIFSGTYSFTDSITSTITYFNSFNIEENLAAGASRGNGFGSAQVLQIDLSARF
jgi:hypothetical protein